MSTAELTENTNKPFTALFLTLLIADHHRDKHITHFNSPLQQQNRVK